MNSRSLIIALGAGLSHKRPQDPPYRWIGQETKFRAAAAATLWQLCPNSLLIFSGGRGCDTETPSEAETMQGYVERPPWNVPAERILTENDSIDTASNVRNVAAIILERGLSTERITLIAGRSNLARAAAYFRAYGIHVTPKLARGILGSSREYSSLQSVHDVPSLTIELKAFLLRLEQWVDPKGLLVTRLRQWQRALY